MKNIIKESRAEETQKVASFHGEGAYHGVATFRDVPIPEFEHDEYRPTTLISGEPFKEFEGHYPNDWDLVKQLIVPSQEAIKNDGITFAWVTFDIALQEAGPLTKSVLLAMEPFLDRKKKFIYVDSKIQFFKKGDVAVDSKHWHVDGSVSVRDPRATIHGHSILHDMKARQDCKAPPPKYMSYQSSTHCATEWLLGPLKIMLPACIPSFDLFDELVKKAAPNYYSQPAASIVKFDGFDIHRAVPASDDGWRLWVRVIETDRETILSDKIVSSYGTVYRSP